MTTDDTLTHPPGIPDLGDPLTFAQQVPLAAFDALHARGPMHWQPADRGVKNGGFWFVLDRQTIVDIENDPEHFTATLGMAQPTTGLEPGHPSQDIIFAMDPPRHSRVRRAVMRSFGPRVVAQFDAWVTDIVVEALDDAFALHEFDYVQEVAVTIPSRVVARVMGVPDVDRHKIVEWSVAIFEGQAQGDVARIMQASQALFDYVTQLQEQRLSEPADDMISELAAAVARDELSQVEYLQYCRALLIAGFETTHTVIGQSMRMMLEDPDVMRAVREGMAGGGVNELIEEFLRMITPAMHFARTATADHEFAGEQVHANDVMVMSYAAANRDPKIYEDPHRFWPGRPRGSDHLAFGSGAHRCIGQALARLELRILLEELHRRDVRLELAGQPRRGHSTFINQLLELPVRNAS
jgi:cholest-4-en-3-one 26-monooxygenase